MDRMRFKTFYWPNNPEKLVIEHTRDPLYGKDSQGNTVFLSMGAANCTVSGSGVFSGELAYDSFLELELLFKELSSGTLALPQEQTLRVYFTELTMEQDSRPQYVHYSFTFRAADENDAIPA